MVVSNMSSHLTVGHHLLIMLYAVIMRFDSLCEIEALMLAEVRKPSHIGLESVSRR